MMAERERFTVSIIVSCVAIAFSSVNAIIVWRQTRRRIPDDRYGRCVRCDRPWNRCEPRSVMYERADGGARGRFFLCEDCWARTTTDERVTLYRADRLRQSALGFAVTDDEAGRIEAAIRAEGDGGETPTKAG